MSNIIQNGASTTVNLQTGEKLAISAIDGTFSAVIRAGVGVGTALATNSLGGEYGPYVSPVVIQVSSSADGLVDFEVGTVPTLDYREPVTATTNPLTGGIALSAGGGANILDGQFYPSVHLIPESSDSTSVIQSALNKVKTRGGGVVHLHGSFSISDTLRLPSRVAIVGDGPFYTSITQTATNKPVIASRNYFASESDYPDGYMGVVGLRIVGSSGAASHGIIIRDYYSRIKDVEVWSCGGDGIRVSAVDDAATLNAYTLVENRYESILVSGCSGYGLYAPSQSVKMTDSFLTDFVCQAAAGGSLGGLNLQVSAGWQIRNIHTYGTFSGAGATICRAWNTIFDGAQIEPGWGTFGLDFTATQRAFSIDNISVAGGVAGGVAIRALKDGTNAGDGFNFGSVTVINDSNVDMTAITWDSDTCPVYVGNLSMIGAYASRITPTGGFGAGAIRYRKDMRVESKVRDSAGLVSLAVNDIPVALSKKSNWNGGGSNNISLTLPKLAPWTQWAGIVIVNGSINYDGGAGASAAYFVIVSSKAAGSTWSCYATAIGTSAGFSSAPVVSVTNINDSGSLSVAFTASNSGNYGVCSLLSLHS